MGVIRRVGLTSQLMRRECSRSDRGELGRGPSLTASTIAIIITTRTCCSGEMLLPVKQQKGPCSPTTCRCWCVCARVGGALYMCTYAYMCLRASCCLHNSLPLTVHSFPFTSPLCLPPSSISHCITPYIHDFPVYHENLCMKIEGGKAGKKAKKQEEKNKQG